MKSVNTKIQITTEGNQGSEEKGCRQGACSSPRARSLNSGRPGKRFQLGARSSIRSASASFPLFSSVQVSFCCVAGLAAVLFAASVSASPHNPDTDWFHDAGWGVFVHYLWDVQNVGGHEATQGKPPTTWDALVREFDTESLATRFQVQLSLDHSAWTAVAKGKDHDGAKWEKTIAAVSALRQVPAVPRWTGAQRPVIRGSPFLAPVRLPGGTPQERPVFFTGCGHFGQVVSDMEKSLDSVPARPHLAPATARTNPGEASRVGPAPHTGVARGWAAARLGRGMAERPNGPRDRGEPLQLPKGAGDCGPDAQRPAHGGTGSLDRQAGGWSAHPCAA